MRVIKKSSFLLYDNLVQRRHLALCRIPASAQPSQETCSGFGMRLMEAVVGAGPVGDVVLKRNVEECRGGEHENAPGSFSLAVE